MTAASSDNTHLIVWRHHTRYADEQPSVDDAVSAMNWIEDDGSGSCEAIVVGPLDDPASWESAIRGDALVKLGNDRREADYEAMQTRSREDTRPVCPDCNGRLRVSITAPDGDPLQVICPKCGGSGRLPDPTKVCAA